MSTPETTYQGILNRTTFLHRNSGPVLKNYKGIKCLITLEEIKELWIRDKAFKMSSPSIDRIDPKGHYQKENCRFIEKSVNSSIAHEKRSSNYVGISFESKRNRMRKWRGHHWINGVHKTTKWCLTEDETIKEYKKKFRKAPFLVPETHQLT